MVLQKMVPKMVPTNNQNGNVAPPLVYNSCVTLKNSRWSSWSSFRNFDSTRPSKSDSTPPQTLLLFNREVSTRNIRSNLRPHEQKHDEKICRWPNLWGAIASATNLFQETKIIGAEPGCPPEGAGAQRQARLTR